MIACREGHERLVQELLKANADVNAVSKVRYCTHLKLHPPPPFLLIRFSYKYGGAVIE